MTVSKLNTTPIVSIVTVSFNSAATIADTLLSVAEQTYPAIEHIIIDGLSKDDTVAVVRKFPHVATLITEKDNGIYDAMNKGIALAKGEIIGILNSDDFYTSSDVIEKVVEAMQQQQSDALYADLVYISPDTSQKQVRKWIANPFDSKKFLFGWMPPHPTFFVRRSAYETFGQFNTQLRSAADYELMLRFLYKHQIKVVYLPKIIVKMRAGGNSNASLRNRIRANREDRMAWKLNSLKPYFFTLWLKPIRKIVQLI